MSNIDQSWVNEEDVTRIKLDENCIKGCYLQNLQIKFEFSSR